MLPQVDVTLAPPVDEELLDPKALFNTPGPFELEIGCGKGGFLLDRARNRPDVRLLGIEWANKYYIYAADRMARWGLSNVRVMRTDARHFVIRHLPPACLSVLHVYHPDPWPKKRHHKRRLFQSDFVEAAVRATVDGGTWRIQSDHQDYFGIIRGMLDAHPALSEVPFDDPRFKPSDQWEGTNFENKYARQGLTIHRVAYVVRHND